MQFEYFITIISVLIILSIFLSKLSDNFGIPTLILFLVLGMLAGSEGIGKINFRDFEITKSIGIACLVLILFSGGLSTKISEVKPVIKSALSLSTLGMVLTMGIMGITIHLIIKLSIYESLLIGAIISSTDAAAVFSAIRGRNVLINDKVKNILEFESGSNDPIAVLMTVLFIDLYFYNVTNFTKIAGFIILQFIIGGLAGILFGKIYVRLINKIKFSIDSFYTVLGLVFSFFVYGITNLLLGSGFLAVYIASLVLANSEFVQKKSLTRFYDGSALLGQIIMFLTMGLLVNPSELIPVAGIGFIIAGILIIFARPISVFISLALSKFSINEKLFISWVGLKGSVPIILAIFPLIANVNDGLMFFNLVFFVTITSALVQGWSITGAAKFLRVTKPGTDALKLPLSEANYPVGSVLFEYVVPAGSKNSGKSLAEIAFPERSLVTLICRNEDYIVPNGNSVIEQGDLLMILIDKQKIDELKHVLT